MSKLKTPFENFVDAMVDELIAMPDEQVLEGFVPNAVQADGSALLNAAKTEAGRRRLAAAKSGLASLKEARTNVVLPDVSADEARRYVAQAANDNRYTLAARSLGDLSDEEALRLYRQLKTLEVDVTKKGAPE
jgi:hypothetical protein